MGAIVASVPIMRKIANKTMDGKTALRIARLLRELDKESQVFQETRTRLLQMYGEVVQDNQIRIPNEKMMQFNKEMQEALNVEIEVNAEPLSEEFVEKMEITPTEVSVLMPFIQ